MPSTSAQIADVISSLSFDGIPIETVQAAETSLLDAVGVSMAASGLDMASTAFSQLVIQEGGRGESTVIGHGVRVPAAGAAFANGALAHALDFEDAIDEAPVHPNAQVVPPVLALAESRDLSGPQLVTAIAVGCDLTTRLGSAVGTQLSDRGWYPPPILGTLGATAACSNLLGLSPRQALDALSLAVSQTTASGEIKFSPQSTIRGVRDSFSCQVAIRSVQLAELGIRGFDAPLEGHSGFFATYVANDYDPAILLDGLGRTFAGSRVSYKPWPSCRGTHAFIEGALELRQQVSMEEIASVELVGAPVWSMLAEPQETKRRPTTAIDAKFSLMYTVAVAIIDGEVGLASFFPDHLMRIDVRSLAERVTYTVDDSLSDSINMSFGRTTIRTRDGRELVYETSSPRGNPRNPVSRNELLTKFVDCAKHAAKSVERSVAAGIAEALLDIHKHPHLRSLLGDLLAGKATTN